MSAKPGSLNWAIITGGIISALASVGLAAGLVVMLRGGLPQQVNSDGGSQDMPHIVVTPSDEGDEPVAEPAGVEADDGELHSAENHDVSYTLTADHYRRNKIEQLDAYGLKVQCNFDINYPQVSDDLEHAKKINRVLRRVARETAITYYDEPSAETVERFTSVVEDVDPGDVTEGADALLESTVDYAVTYNDENLLSVCYSDVYYLGSYALGFCSLRTVNINLKTGEVYELDDVLTVDEQIARSFVDNLVRTDGEDENGDGTIVDRECFTIALCGRDAFEQALQGTGELAGKRVVTCLFIDGNGQPNLGVTYWISGSRGFVRGWWDVTITDEQLETTRKDSTLWELLGK